MSYRQKPNGTWVVEIYDPVAKKKGHVKARDYGMEVPRTERQAKALERAALNARDGRRRGARDETCSSFAERWADDYDGRGRGEGTRVRLRQSVKAFGEHDDFKDRPLPPSVAMRGATGRRPTRGNCLRCARCTTTRSPTSSPTRTRSPRSGSSSRRAARTSPF